jgi:hypothetical protein
VWKRWVPVAADVTPWTGGTVTFRFLTTGNDAWGWTMWGSPAVYQSTNSCLTLNTWAPLHPGNRKDKLLVIVCLFEGATKWGRGNTPGQDPSNRASFLSASVCSHPRFFTSLSSNKNVALESIHLGFRTRAVWQSMSKMLGS